MKEGQGEESFGGDISSICIAPMDQDMIKGGEFVDFMEGDDGL